MGKKILLWATRISVVVLLLSLFVGRINPGRISGVMGKNVSLIKSAVFFRSLAEDVVALDAEAMEAGDAESSGSEFDPLSLDPDDFENEEDYWNAFYANAVAAADDSVGSFSSDEYDYDFDADDDFEDDDEILGDNYLKGVKIDIPSWKNIWKAFEENHAEIAAALTFDRLVCLITVVSVIIALAGLYLSFATNKLRKIGYLVTALGSAFTALSMLFYPAAYNKLTATMDMLEVEAQWPPFRLFFVILSALIMVLAILSFFFAEEEITEKTIMPLSPLQATYRILALLAFLLLFIPGANPARISEKISRNMSLFTSGFFYNAYTDKLQQILSRGVVPESIFRLANISALLTDLAIILCGAGACMSVGNNKLKRYGHFCLIPGSLILAVSQFGFIMAYRQEVAFGNTDRTNPLEPASVIIYLVIAVAILLCSLVSFIRTPAPEKGEKCHFDAPMQLFLMLLPFLLLIFIFSYLPLWGWRYAFFDYEAGGELSMENWVGLKWFKQLFIEEQTRKDVLRVLRNTLVMSGLGIATSWCPMVFAIFLSEIKNNASRRIIQTLTTIPNFISWVLVYAIAFCIFGTEGFMNNLLVKLLHIKESGTNYLMDGSGIWIKMLLWGMWKGLGWSAIMYIAAISGIDQQLYEAATVDGAGRFQKMWHITLPELIPTYIVLLILSISNVLSNGMDQYFCFKNPNNKEAIEVLDLYVYQLSLGAGSGSNNIPFSTVVSMFKSVVSVILLFITNRISKAVRGSSIF